MFKVETHCHIAGLSCCGDGSPNILLEKYAQKGYDAIITTTHVSKYCYDYHYQGETHKEKIDYFYKIHEEFKNLANEYGIRTFMGIEVQSIVDGQEYMLIGQIEKLMYDNVMYEYSQQDLFEMANKNGLFMYQTHPFREGVMPGDGRFLHGVEIFNGHYHHENNNQKAEAFCKQYNLVGVSGTDYHHNTQPILGGILTAKALNDEKELVKCLFENKFKCLINEEEYIREYIEYIKFKEAK